MSPQRPLGYKPPINPPHPLRLDGINRIRKEHNLRRAARTDKSCQTLQSTDMDESAGDLGDLEAGVGTREPHVHGQGEFVPAADGAAVDLGDEDGGEGGEEVEDGGEFVQGVVRVGVGWGEGVFGAGDVQVQVGDPEVRVGGGGTVVEVVVVEGGSVFSRVVRKVWRSVRRSTLTRLMGDDDIVRRRAEEDGFKGWRVKVE